MPRLHINAIDCAAPRADSPAVEEVKKLHEGLATRLLALALSDDNLAATVATLEELLGSRAAAQSAVRRNLVLLNFGSASVRRNWAALQAHLGGSRDAAVQAVQRYPGLLKFDLRQPMSQQRLRFYQQECGVAQERVLNSYLGEAWGQHAPGA